VSERADTFLADRPFPYCKGCGHGVVARRLSEALVAIGIAPERVVLTSDIGCVGLVDPYFPSVHSVHTIHGRSTAIAAGAVLADGVLADGAIKNLVMIGDGGATIGLLHLSQAALMNVDVTVLLHNNMLYGMTGGQHSALTPEGLATSTTPEGNWLPALDMAALVQSCHGGFFARKLATDADLADVIARAVAHPGFAVVEILELCTGFAVPLNKMDGKSLKRLADERGHALGVLIEQTSREPYHEVYKRRFPPRAEPEPKRAASARFAHRVERATTLVVAGSAGERVQSAAALLSQAAVLSGLHCVQKNDYPVTVGSGFSLAEVKLAPEPILYTGSEVADVLMIVSADGMKVVSARGDLARLAPDGLIFADETIAASLPAERTRVYPLRKRLSADAAALGAIALWLRHSQALELDAMYSALELIAGKGAAAQRRTIDATGELVTVGSSTRADR
jgi:2-oxoglutarate/2-oxoacid ferredoxin oxidoreductase subunit beta